MNAQSGPWQGKCTVPCTASGSLLFVGDGAVEQAARLPGVSEPHPCVAFRINTLPKAGSKHTFTQGSSSQEGTPGDSCPSAGNSEEGQGLVHQPQHHCILPRHEAPPQASEVVCGLLAGGRTQWRVLAPHRAAELAQGIGQRGGARRPGCRQVDSF